MAQALTAHPEYRIILLPLNKVKNRKNRIGLAEYPRNLAAPELSPTGVTPGRFVSFASFNQGLFPQSQQKENR